ncbi:substrate-binding domain-containing protein [Halioglobus pacificus]|uniref:Iron ABC transporter substrate-binding protein n=1 Tax=Parahalioglobus pacificus TaxID=930806 RepID=A0A919CLL3_9GAMM|nr:substrate-binding domain-containing protein [Halioglobus pacificus]GHD37235.1 iron ABC transporter substrate-binding protein [Halioglobus pacificus]
MRRRAFIQGMAAAGGLAFLPSLRAATSVDELPPLEGDLTLYLGRGEGGLYENVLKAIETRNPKLKLGVRRGPTAALANAIVAEGKAGVQRADVFWAVDSGAVGLISDAGIARPLPSDVAAQLQLAFRYDNWTPVTGRIRTLPYHTGRLSAEQIPEDIMAFPDSGLTLGWSPAYASFQSFITAMRLLEGDAATKDWLQRVKRSGKSYAGELGVVMAVERGEVDVGFANHYYTLRLKAGKPDANVALAYTRNDAGCLVNASAAVAVSDKPLATNFIRYLLTEQVQSYLAREAYEIPLVEGVAPPGALPRMSAINPPEIDLTALADLRPTLDLMRDADVL